MNGAFLICEMFGYYAARGISLLDKLDELYKTFGYCLNTLHSYEFEGSAGFEKMQAIMKSFREEIGVGQRLGGKEIQTLLDYSAGLEGLPKADVLKYLLEGDCSMVVRPSGTEPKLKTYISVCAQTREQAQQLEAAISAQLDELFR